MKEVEMYWNWKKLFGDDLFFEDNIAPRLQVVRAIITANGDHERAMDSLKDVLPEFVDVEADPSVGVPPISLKSLPLWGAAWELSQVAPSDYEIPHSDLLFGDEEISEEEWKNLFPHFYSEAIFKGIRNWDGALSLFGVTPDFQWESTEDIPQELLQVIHQRPPERTVRLMYQGKDYIVSRIMMDYKAVVTAREANEYRDECQEPETYASLPPITAVSLTPTEYFEVDSPKVVYWSWKRIFALRSEKLISEWSECFGLSGQRCIRKLVQEHPRLVVKYPKEMPPIPTRFLTDLMFCSLVYSWGYSPEKRLRADTAFAEYQARTSWLLSLRRNLGVHPRANLGWFAPDETEDTPRPAADIPTEILDQLAGQPFGCGMRVRWQEEDLIVVEIHLVWESHDGSTELTLVGKPWEGTHKISALVLHPAHIFDLQN